MNFYSCAKSELLSFINEHENGAHSALVSEIFDSWKLSDDQIENFERAFYAKHAEESMYDAVLKLHALKPFAAGGNIWSSGQEIDEPTLFAMRWIAGIKFEEVLDILKFDRQDSNLIQELEVGNIGTAQRWTKTVTGSNLEADDEMMCGRYAKPPRLATFPSDDVDINPTLQKAPITKMIDISSVCSHHLLAYGTQLKEGAYAFVSYIPGDFVLGISKLQRLADWVCRRPTIQEDLTKELYHVISEAAKTEDVFIFIGNALHTCEFLRGAQAAESGFTTMHFGGAYSDKALRDSVIRSVQKRN